MHFWELHTGSGVVHYLKKEKMWVLQRKWTNEWKADLKTVVKKIEGNN